MGSEWPGDTSVSLDAAYPLGFDLVGLFRPGGSILELGTGTYLMTSKGSLAYAQDEMTTTHLMTFFFSSTFAFPFISRYQESFIAVKCTIS